MSLSLHKKLHSSILELFIFLKITPHKLSEKIRFFNKILLALNAFIALLTDTKPQLETVILDTFIVIAVLTFPDISLFLQSKFFVSFIIIQVGLSVMISSVKKTS